MVARIARATRAVAPAAANQAREALPAPRETPVAEEPRAPPAATRGWAERLAQAPVVRPDPPTSTVARPARAEAPGKVAPGATAAPTRGQTAATAPARIPTPASADAPTRTRSRRPTARARRPVARPEASGSHTSSTWPRAECTDRAASPSTAPPSTPPEPALATAKPDLTESLSILTSESSAWLGHAERRGTGQSEHSVTDGDASAAWRTGERAQRGGRESERSVADARASAAWLCHAERGGTGGCERQRAAPRKIKGVRAAASRPP